MEQYRAFNLLRANELLVKRNGWFRPSYELTDDQFSYGKLRYEGFWRPRVIIETDAATWTLKRSGWGDITVYGSNGEVIGTTSHKCLDRKITFNTADGFEAVFYSPSIWKSSCIWSTPIQGDIMSIRHRAFKSPAITLLAQPDKQSHLLLLAFLALEIMLTRQRHAAAAGTH